MIGAFLAVTGSCPINIKLFLEGEEESGSPSLRGIVARHRDKLQADAMLSADGARASTTIPTLGIGGRGLAGVEFTLRTAAKDGHSGRYGGAVRNAVVEMAALIAGLHDRQGRIQVAGFGDDALPISNAMRVAAAALPFDEQEFYAGIGGTSWGDPTFTVRELTTIRPTIELNGMWGGYTNARAPDGCCRARRTRERSPCAWHRNGSRPRPRRVAWASGRPGAGRRDTELRAGT